MGFWNWLNGGNDNQLTSDEIEDIQECEDYYKSDKGIDHPDWDDHQARHSSLVERGVYQERNEYGDWVWHKDTSSTLNEDDEDEKPRGFWGWLNGG